MDYNYVALFCIMQLSPFQTEGGDAVNVPLTGGLVGKACDEVDLSCNALLWLGKDYSNFIKKDWTQLDQPFQGTYWSCVSMHAGVRAVVCALRLHCNIVVVLVYTQ